MGYDEDDFLMISGIQHFSFCPRQWALIHIDQVWDENIKTIEGNIVHENCHNPDFVEKRGEFLISRGIRIASRTLGVTGQCDVVEFHRDAAGISLAGREGRWVPYPVEYKKGKPNAYGADELQLCAQAICLEEMLLCSISEGALFYGEPHRRTPVLFDDALREKVLAMLREMRTLMARSHTPKATPGKSCNACSLKDLCLPRLARIPAASDYLRQHLPDKEDVP